MACVCVPGAPCAAHGELILAALSLDSARARLEEVALAWGEHQEGFIGRMGGPAGTDTLALRSRVLMAARSFSMESRRVALARLRTSGLERLPLIGDEVRVPTDEERLAMRLAPTAEQRLRLSKLRAIAEACNDGGSSGRSGDIMSTGV